MARLIILGVTLAVCLAYVSAECNKKCTREYTPVCAVNKQGEHKTFNNLCLLKVVECENPSAGWFMTKAGECPTITTCNRICTADYTPVCAVNKQGEQKTFSNLCQLQGAECENPSAGWYMTKAGECAIARTCNRICSADYTPVCAVNKQGEQKTFSNLCQLQGAVCENPSAGWYMTKAGECAIARTCNRVCSADYTPVCAVNKQGEQKTFSNLCQLQGTVCENPSAGWLMTKAGECATTRTCNRVCSADYTPVCAVNKQGEQKTFSNLCQLEGTVCENPSAGWYMTKAGECAIARTCNRVCSADYTPVCAVNKQGEHKTFSNLCQLQGAECENPSAGWLMTKAGECATAKTCNRVCSADYTPVCAVNKQGEQKTFSNLCQLQGAVCENPSAGWFMTKAGECATTRTCNRVCPADYTPVCAVNKQGEHKTFSNLCQLQGSVCENPSAGWYMTKAGECAIARTCNRVCSADYTPVCAVNKQGELKTFSNLCQLKGAECENPSAGWLMTKAGECATASTCNRVCTADFIPVCGLNKNGEYMTFGNPCQFNLAKCDNPTAGWRMVRSGECN